MNSAEHIEFLTKMVLAIRESSFIDVDPFGQIQTPFILSLAKSLLITETDLADASFLNGELVCLKASGHLQRLGDILMLLFQFGSLPMRKS